MMPCGPNCKAWPFPGNEMLGPEVTYQMVPLNDQPGMVLVALVRSKNGVVVVVFVVIFVGGDWKSGFSRISVFAEPLC